MKIVFFGSGAFGIPTIQALARRHTIQAVVTQPDRKAGRGGRVSPTPIGQWAADHLANAPLLKPERVREPEQRDRIRAFEADAWVVIAFGQKLPPDLLEGRFAINLHASLLPRWRGAAPVNAAIVGGDLETGNSVITLAERMDAGFILAQSRRPIEPTTTAGELHDLLALDGPPLVMGVLERHARDQLEPVVQDESMVTLAPKMSRGDGWISLDEDADLCRRRINGYSPWPGVTVRFRGEPLKLLRADSQKSGATDDPGRIIDPANGLVACKQGTALRLLEVQPPGKKAMAWGDFARGRAVTPDDHIRGGPRVEQE